MTNEVNPSNPDSENKKISRKAGALLAVLILLAGAAMVLSFWGPWTQKSRQRTEQQSSPQGDVYYCPMHKNYQTDKPGNCPICSMKLVKMEKPDAAAKTDSVTQPGSTTSGAAMADKVTPLRPMSPEENKVFVSPEQQQLTGIKTATVTLRALSKELRTVGKITYDETRISHIHTKVSGWIEQVFVDYVGKPVRKGDAMFTIYSPDLVATQEEYLLALRARKELKDSSFERIASSAENLVEASRRRLQLWDVTEQEIARLEKEGKARRELVVYSPVTGLVTERAAYHHGRYVTPEMDLYTIVDLSRVWALGEIYEYELPLVHPGLTAIVEMPYGNASQSLMGTVSYVYPFVNPNTRTGQIRIEFNNFDHRLKPDMFVNVRLNIALGRQLTVPEDAVLDTGTQQYVFIDKGGGYFEPREVKVGERASGFYLIKGGVRPGEQVVTSANFILDSESRLKGAFANMGVPKKPAAASAQGGQQLQIQLRTEPDPAKVGDNTIHIKVADSKGTPISDASVRIRISMPAMGSMFPMSSEGELSSKGNGDYAGRLNIPMAWTWQAVVTVERGGQMLGSRQFNVTA
ncbi:MAG TPA: efflux RND transporter periplasmic adaptor subunit, partial [Acidobacteriota bacterium]|nr:efflux RND transporter periplasmic adaptor subunit [Acidobacteriota bacterium]